MLNQFGAVGGTVRRSPLGAGEQRVLLPFSRRKKVVAAAACTKGSWFWPRGQTTPKFVRICLPITGSTPLPDTGQPRPFVSKQKDAKVAFPPCVLAANEMICRSFRRRGSSQTNSPRLAGLRLPHPIAARYIWDILSGVYRLNRAGPRRLFAAVSSVGSLVSPSNQAVDTCRTRENATSS